MSRCPALVPPQAAFMSPSLSSLPNAESGYHRLCRTAFARPWKHLIPQGSFLTASQDQLFIFNSIVQFRQWGLDSVSAQCCPVISLQGTSPVPQKRRHRKPKESICASFRLFSFGKCFIFYMLKSCRNFNFGIQIQSHKAVIVLAPP